MTSANLPTIYICFFYYYYYRIDSMRKSVYENREDFGGKIKIEANSVASAKHPERNEDAYFDDAEKGIFGVFDGVGGASAGDKASRLALESVQGSLKSVSERASLEEVTEAVRHAILEANRAVLAQQKIERNDMCTTASVGMIWNGQNEEQKAIIGNVGDSRVYLIRNGKLQQITLDDNLARQNARNEQEARLLQAKMNNVIEATQLSPVELALFKERNVITQAIGMEMEDIQPNMHVVDLLPSDKLFVCSDGISDNLTDTEIEAVLNANPDAQSAMQKLIEATRSRANSNHPRAKADDISGMIVEVRGSTK